MNTKPTHMRFSEDTLRDLDNLRRLETDLPNRTEMMRRLIERAKSQKTKINDE